MKNKNKRIKRVFSSIYDVADLWAKQSQSDARCKNAYFQNESIYSYGSHYLLGKIIAHGL